ncbi:uncharacterized protein LOC129906336 [Episyrphus balteatus]|uniref:uncharacterized protein LOC129906336 n=1 Tax=Episyrphus balteatus TaxID=286459 RepID=UPI002486CC02|nr:uncharacterized protein LOC129906336 [Episyrphus balteatus]
MYRQVLVDPNDRMLQLILWRPDRNSQLQIYQLNTVTYGSASASYLATRCLLKLAEDNEENYPLASQAIKKNFYVDDCSTGAETLEDAKSLLTDVTKILKQRNFELRKFCSNHPDILQSVPEEQKEQLVAFHQSEVIKMLGLIWDPALDAFRFKFDLDEINENEKVCKRTVLSNLASLFDPLGLLAPVIVLGKLFLQELWKTKSSWDYQLPEDQANKWLRYLNSFSMLKDLSIPRYASCPCKKKNVELHAFSDSSQKAYGSCVYIRSVDDNEIINSHLLCSKSRICPLKVTTIARLELQGAVLMVELVARLLPLFSNEFRRVCYYTDSTTVLAWIKSPSYTWDTYVANRVAKIQANTDIEQWHFVRGNINPADMVSRGLDLPTLLNTSIWFRGPDFLNTFDILWETIPEFVQEDIPERRKMRSVLAAHGCPK